MSWVNAHNDEVSEELRNVDHERGIAKVLTMVQCRSCNGAGAVIQTEGRHYCMHCMGTGRRVAKRFAFAPKAKRKFDARAIRMRELRQLREGAVLIERMQRFEEDNAELLALMQQHAYDPRMRELRERAMRDRMITPEQEEMARRRVDALIRQQEERERRDSQVRDLREQAEQYEWFGTVGERRDMRGTVIRRFRSVYGNGTVYLIRLDSDHIVQYAGTTAGMYDATVGSTIRLTARIKYHTYTDWYDENRRRVHGVRYKLTVITRPTQITVTQEG